MIALEIAMAVVPIALALTVVVAAFVVVVRISDRQVSGKGFADMYLRHRDPHADDDRDAMRKARGL
ncbi:hypothetical protein [Aeromicrobium sp. UC242_57]|uniref:hypothetical protein n=1 Tax=Aeromicrobium sp. UC242_57 TaxID=3374624 RepID=UPI0037C0EA57